MPEILVIKPSSFGDIIHGLQVAETIRRRVPDARISWIAAGAFAPFVKACTSVAKVFEFERGGGIRGFVRLMRGVRANRFDYVLDMQGLARSGLMTFFARGGRKIGRTDSREGARLFYHERVLLPRTGSHSHAVEILLQFLTVFGQKPTLEGELFFRPSGKSASLAEIPSGRGPLVLMFPDSRRPEKNWSGFPALTELLFKNYSDLRIAWAGSQRLADPAGTANRTFINLTGRTRVDELPTLVKSADCVIANDSGPMHLAAAMGRRVLAIFGPTDPKRFGPYPLDNPRHHVVRAPGGRLQQLTPQQVATALEEAGLAMAAR